MFSLCRYYYFLDFSLFDNLTLKDKPVSDGTAAMLPLCRVTMRLAMLSPIP